MYLPACGMARLDPQASDLINQNAAKKRLILRETGGGVQRACPAACRLCLGGLEIATGLVNRGDDPVVVAGPGRPTRLSFGNA
jgi:hypothetical protein